MADATVMSKTKYRLDYYNFIDVIPSVVIHAGLLSMLKDINLVDIFIYVS